MKMPWEFLVLYYILSILAQYVNAIQRFIEVPVAVDVNPDEDAVLICRIAEKKGICSWQKDNKPVGLYVGKYEWANEKRMERGDCSLRVRGAKLQLDDGQWQCQVTASNYDVQDALSSLPAILSVRVPPQSPRIIYEKAHLMPGQNITIAAGDRATIACEVRYGNPPAFIEWYLDKERLTSWSQTNTSEPERPRVWQARSSVDLAIARSTHGRNLTCRAVHPSYTRPNYRESYAMLDVTFVPVVSIVGPDASKLASLEEDSSALTLECKADGNPSPHVWWTKSGQIIPNKGAKLIMAPVIRNHSGIYGCQARNSKGTSDMVTIEIDIKYRPRVKWVGPDIVMEANLFSEVIMECKADGNPKPTYTWYYNPSTSVRYASILDGSYPVSETPQLILQNVTYDQHGQYICVASNQIGLKERIQPAEPITLNVVGPPVGAQSSSVQVWSGKEARLTATVCADPKPRRAYWYWGSLQLDVPSQLGRFRGPEPDSDGSCYRYTLIINNAGVADERVYRLNVENEKGRSSQAVSLTVHDNFSLTETTHVAPILVSALAIAALLVMALCLIIRCRRRREIVEYRTEETEREKGALPADAVYTPHLSPGAMSSAGFEAGVSRVAAVAGVAGVAGGTGSMMGARYSPAALQAAFASLEKEAKENVYAVLEPRIQYEITINKHGEPPKYLSLSKPLTHQRTHAFDPQNISNEINNNNYEKFSTFKTGPPKARRSNKSNCKNNQQNFVCQTNNDIEYSKDPYFGKVRSTDLNNQNAQKYNENKDSKNYSRMYERNNFGRKENDRRNQNGFEKDFQKAKRSSNRSWKGTNEKERDFEDFTEGNRQRDIDEDFKPRLGKVREIASRFNKCSSGNVTLSAKKERPKPLQSYGNQAYLDHVFPDAVEI